jgi:hypothetical protein
VATKNKSTKLIGGSKRPRISFTLVAVTLLVGAGAVIFQVKNPPGAAAYDGYSASVYNGVSSDITAALRNSRYTSITQYLRPGSKYYYKCTTPDTSYNQFYTHADMTVRLKGNFIVGNGVTETYYYADTGWHTFPKNFLNCQTDIAFYEYDD